MLSFVEDRKVIVKRYSSVLGEYNRPTRTLNEVGSYLCHVSHDTSSTAQKQPQKELTTDLTLFVDTDADIKEGDILYIYELDEYEDIILSTEHKALADKPYKKRTILAVPLVSTEEV